MDGRFRVDETCTSCGICEKVCPAANIRLEPASGVNPEAASAKQPVWLHRCEQCYACLQWCPEAAIQWGDKTAGRDRYHHPEVKVTDLFLR